MDVAIELINPSVFFLQNSRIYALLGNGKFYFPKLKQDM